MASPIAPLGDHPAQQRRRAVALLASAPRVARRASRARGRSRSGRPTPAGRAGSCSRPASRHRRPRASRCPRRPRSSPRSRVGRRSSRAPAPAHRPPIRRACRATEEGLGRAPRFGGLRVTGSAPRAATPRTGAVHGTRRRRRACRARRGFRPRTGRSTRVSASSISGSGSSGDRPMAASIRMSGGRRLELDVEHRRIRRLRELPAGRRRAGPHPRPPARPGRRPRRRRGPRAVPSPVP